MSYGNSAGLYRLAMESLNLQVGVDLVVVACKGPAATRLMQAGRTKPLRCRVAAAPRRSPTYRR